MNEYEEKLKAYMADKGIQGKHVVFPESCHSVEAAAAAAGTSPDNIVKNICLEGQDRLIVAILKGEDRVDRSLVAQVVNMEKVKIAAPDWVLDRAGYPCGGIPSFGFEAIFIVDTRVMEKDLVYSGGGSLNSLLVISPGEILRANGGIVADIRKKD